VVRTARTASPSGQAPVCKAIRDGTLIREADLISDYNPGAQSDIVALLVGASPTIRP
jgi:hypothetical protein